MTQNCSFTFGFYVCKVISVVIDAQTDFFSTNNNLKIFNIEIHAVFPTKNENAKKIVKVVFVQKPEHSKFTTDTPKCHKSFSLVSRYKFVIGQKSIICVDLKLWYFLCNFLLKMSYFYWKLTNLQLQANLHKKRSTCLHTCRILFIKVMRLAGSAFESWRFPFNELLNKLKNWRPVEPLLDIKTIQ